jgi:CHAD domain-containing protein
MGIPRIQYLISTFNAKDLQACIPTGMTLKAVSPTGITRRYFDSFDWRLLNKQTCFYAEQRGDDEKIVLTSLDENDVFTQMPGTALPRFYWDLPPCRLRQSLSPILKQRALMHKIAIAGDVETVLLKDSNRKTVLKIEFERDMKASDGQQAPASLPNRLVIQPVKGYELVLEQIRPCIESLESTAPHVEGSLEAALRQLDRLPSPVAPDYEFESHTSAIAAIRQIGQVQLKVMLANQQGILEDVDSEFLHDFRVAVRRTRTLLTQAKGLLASELLSWLKDEFRWLGQATGHPRDMDVYLLHFPAYEKMLDEDLRADLKPLREYLQAERDEAYRQLKEVLQSERYQTLLRRWGELLTTAKGAKPASAKATQPIAEMANEAIWKTYRRVRKQGKAITPASPAEDYHTLRKTCKKLRYLLEFYSGLYPRKQIKKRIAELKLLQDNLGQFQDYQVQEARLREFAEQMQQQGLAEVRTYLAMGKLIDNMLTESEKVRQEFTRCFAAFSDDKVHEHFTHNFKPAAIDTTIEDTGLL